MPLNPFKRRASTKPEPARVAAHSPAASEASTARRGSLRDAPYIDRSPPRSLQAGETSSHHSSSSQHPPPMFKFGRRAPFGANVKYKPPPSHSPTPPHSRSSSSLAAPQASALTIPPIESAEYLDSSRRRDSPQEMTYSDAPHQTIQRDMSVIELEGPPKPEKKRTGFFSLFRRKSKKSSMDDARSDTGSRFHELTQVPSGSSQGSSTRKKLMKKRVS